MLLEERGWGGGDFTFPGPWPQRAGGKDMTALIGENRVVPGSRTANEPKGGSPSFLLHGAFPSGLWGYGFQPEEKDPAEDADDFAAAGGHSAQVPT